MKGEFTKEELRTKLVKCQEINRILFNALRYARRFVGMDIVATIDDAIEKASGEK